MSKKLSLRARRLRDEHNRAVVLLGHVATAMQEAKSLARLSLTELAAVTGVDRIELHRFGSGRATLRPGDLDAVIAWIDSVEGAVADVPMVTATPFLDARPALAELLFPQGRTND